MIEYLFYVIILALGIPVGIILAKLCNDEIKKWKKRLMMISAICVILAIALGFIIPVNLEYKFPIILTLLFIIITNLTIIKSKSFM